MPFDNVRDIIPDNGEVYYHKYLAPQRHRKQTYPPSPYTDRCNGPCCGMNPVSIPRNLGNVDTGGSKPADDPIIIEYPPPTTEKHTTQTAGQMQVAMHLPIKPRHCP